MCFLRRRGREADRIAAPCRSTSSPTRYAGSSRSVRASCAGAIPGGGSGGWASDFRPICFDGVFGLAGSDECVVSVWQEPSSSEEVQLAPSDSKFRGLSPAPIPIPAPPSIRSLLDSVRADMYRWPKGMCARFEFVSLVALFFVVRLRSKGGPIN